jgi:hypothetical protein
LRYPYLSQIVNLLEEAVIMTFKSDNQPDIEEIRFSGELGWLAALAVSIVAVVPFIFN